MACILTLPSYQRKGYGKFIISFSYELSKKELKVGSPEKPLSDLGQISYRSYWARTLLETLSSPEFKNIDQISVMDLTSKTSIKTEDIMLTLNYLGLIKYLNGRHVLFIPPKVLEEKLNTFKKSRGPQVCLQLDSLCAK